MRGKLNLGCGSNILPGYVNVDDWSMWPLPPGAVVTDAPVICHNLNKFPWPFADGKAGEVRMDHVLEHLPDTGAVMAEVRRILMPGGIFRGTVPYGLSHDFRTHWQHYRPFVARTFHAIADDFGFKVIQVQNATYSISWRHRLRNLVPFRETLALAGWSDAFDKVDFELQKIDERKNSIPALLA